MFLQKVTSASSKSVMKLYILPADGAVENKTETTAFDVALFNFQSDVKRILLKYVIYKTFA